MAYDIFPTASPFAVPGTAAGTLHGRKKASANGGTPGPVASANVVAAAPKLPAPTGLTLSVISATEIDATWNPIPNASNQVYQLQRATVTNGVVGNFGAAHSGLDTFFNDTTRAAGTTYAYRVLATQNGAYATSDPSSVVQATTPGGSAPVITPGTTTSTPVITPFTTTAY